MNRPRKRPFLRRLISLIVAASAAVAAWKWLPGTELDREAFTALGRSFANPPLLVSGEGTHTAPWKLRTLSVEPNIDARRAPVVVSLGDDPTGFFQSSPPAPIDFAVIFNNFQRLGAKQAASAAVLAWDDPDPIGLAALDLTISKFDSLVMSAPLSRGAVPEPMPPAFRKASIPVETIRGDPGRLPVVNRIPLPGIILGSENTLAGFQTLDSEPDTHFMPLIARWDDRIVFSFTVLAVLQRHNLPVNGVEIELGKHLKLSPNGPVVPINAYGRLNAPLGSIPPFAEIPAEALIDATPGIFPNHAPAPVVLRDDRSAAEATTRKFSKKLAATFAAIASDAGFGPARTFHRLNSASELALLSLIALALSGAGGLSAFARSITLLLIGGTCLTIQWIAAGTASVWLPGIEGLAAVAAVFLVSLCFGD